MKHFLSIVAVGGTLILSSQNFQYLDINQVKAGVGCSANLHYNPTANSYYYEVPKNSGKHTDFTSGLWIGGVDISSQLMLAAQRYPTQTSVDFWPGPLRVNDAKTDSATVSDFNRVWKINKSDINDFIINFNNGNVQNGTYIPAADILSWPGNGNITKNYDPLLAPFVDVNSDEIYDPMQGDYPKIKGDQAIFYILNDAYKPHASSGGKIMGLEIQVMAYAFGTCDVVTSDPYLNYTTFYDYKIINRSSNSYYNMYAGFFDDADLGYYGDDYVGCDVKDQYGYMYSSSLPTNEPVTGYQLLKSPYSSSDGIDNDGDGTIDEPFEELGMTGFYYFNNSFAGTPVSTTDPGNAIQYYQYMSGFWRDGTPFTCGGNAYGGAISTKFAFPSNTYTTGPCGSANWMDPGNGTSLSDKRYIISSGPFTFSPGAIYNFEVAHVTSFDSINNQQLSKLDQDMIALKSFYNSGNFNSCIATNLNETEKTIDIQMYPNPATNILTLAYKQFGNSNIQITVTDILGKEVLISESKNTQRINVNIVELSSGVYFIKLTSEGKSTTKKFVKQ